MNKSIWEWLEIEPTGEISEIRAAYARQVKSIILRIHPKNLSSFKKLIKVRSDRQERQSGWKRCRSRYRNPKSPAAVLKTGYAGIFENAGMTEEPNVPSWENTGSMSSVTSEPGTTPDLEIAGTPDEVESEIVSDSEYDLRKSERTNRSSSA